jgi:hypothetical protein
MNERIRQLADEAREYATTRHPVSNIILSVNSDVFEQKFAQLIVRQCAEIADTAEPFLASDLIKEHFGVAE